MTQSFPAYGAAVERERRMEHCLVSIGLDVLDEQSRLPLWEEQADKLPAAGLTILVAEVSGDLLGRDQSERMQGAPRRRCFLHAQSRAPGGGMIWRLTVF